MTLRTPGSLAFFEARVRIRSDGSLAVREGSIFVTSVSTYVVRSLQRIQQAPVGQQADEQGAQPWGRSGSTVQSMPIRRVTTSVSTGATAMDQIVESVDKVVWALGQSEWELVTAINGYVHAGSTFRRPVQPDRAIDDAAARL